MRTSELAASGIELEHEVQTSEGTIPLRWDPTSENLAIWIWDRLRPRLGLLRRVRVAQTRTSRCTYEGGA